MFIDGIAIVRLAAIGAAGYIVLSLLAWAVFRAIVGNSKPGNVRQDAMDRVAARVRKRRPKDPGAVGRHLLRRMDYDRRGARAFLYAWAISRHAVSVAELEDMLVGLLRHTSAAQDFLATVLADTSVETTRLYFRLLSEPDARLRGIALAVLSRGQLVGAEYRPLLRGLVSGSRGRERIQALEALLRSYPEMPSEEEIHGYLSDGDWQVRAIVAREARRWRSSEIVTLLTQLVADPSWWVRNSAAESLAAMGEIGRHALTRVAVGDDRYAADMARQVLAAVDDAAVTETSGIHTRAMP